MVGHSGTGAEAESLVAWGKPPKSAKVGSQLEI